MPWHPMNYPPAMNHLPPPVREKAIEIANALLRAGYDEGSTLRIASTSQKNGQ